MFDALKKLFQAEDEEAVKKPLFDDDDQRLAEAALMFHVIASDGKITDGERERMETVLTGEYGLSKDEMKALYEAAREAEHEAIDLYRFTSTLKRHLDREQRIAIIERMWEMAFADGVMHEFEDNVVWRIAQLMEVETPDRIAMKQRVRARRQS